MSQTPCALVAAATKGFCNHSDVHGLSERKPETEALWFYGMNHAIALIAERRAPLEPLTAWEQSTVERYHAVMSEKAQRAFHYLLLICIRESRHNKSLAQDGPKMASLFGKNVSDFHLSIKGGEHSIHQAFVTNPPNATIGAFVDSMVWAFYNSSWSGGYGGKKWGVVTDCLKRFVHGEFTAEMMLDTVWTLAHNGGPIFNKGMLYDHYGSYLIRLLDVQRSGQIPQAVLSDKHLLKYADSDLILLMGQVRKEFPNQIGEYVDWGVVEALGSVQQYPKEKAEQHAKHGMSPEEKQALIEQKIKEEAQAAKEAEEKANWHLNHFTVMPGVEVKKIIRAQAA
jgi:hypothetical protein